MPKQPPTQSSSGGVEGNVFHKSAHVLPHVTEHFSGEVKIPEEETGTLNIDDIENRCKIEVHVRREGGR